MMNSENRSALITGASSGLGEAIATAAALLLGWALAGLAPGTDGPNSLGS
jgi:NAD(P)-dependent dehydrogenase (short-subunit alcohol dehydrogenase family)